MQKESKNQQIEIRGLPIWFFYVPPLLLLFAPLLYWPSGYYQILRIVVSSASFFMAYVEFKEGKKIFTFLFGFISILFNPFIEINFIRGVWSFFNIVAACFWIFYLLKKGVRAKILALIFGIPVVILYAQVLISFNGGSSPLAESNSRHIGSHRDRGTRYHRGR